ESIDVFTQPVGGEQRDTDGDGRNAGGFETNRDTGNDVRGRTGLRRLGDFHHWSPRSSRVVLRDIDEGERGEDADDAAGGELPSAFWQHRQADAHQENGGEGCADVKALVELAHRVLDVAFWIDVHHADNGRQQAEGTDHQWEEDPRHI